MDCSSPAAAQAPAGGRARPSWPAVVVLWAGMAQIMLDGSAANVALPSIAHDLGIGPAEVIWAVTAYQVVLLALMLPVAAVGSTFGYRRVYLSGVALFTVGAVASGAASTLPWLVASRTLQGMGAAGIMAVNSALLRLVYPPHLLGKGMSLNVMFLSIANAAGPAIAAAVLAHLQWRWIFIPGVPLGLAVFYFGALHLPRNAHHHAVSTLNTVDMLLNVLVFGSLLVAARMVLQRDAFVLLAGICLVLGGIYVRRQLRAPEPLLPIDLLQDRSFALAIATSVAAYAAQMMGLVALPFLLHGRGLQPASIGWVLAAWPVGVLLTSALAGSLIGRVPNAMLGAAGLAGLASGLAGTALAPGAEVLATCVAVFLSGAGFGLFQSPNNHAITGAAAPHRAGAASGLQGTARMCGQTLGAAGVALMADLGSADGIATSAGATMLIAAACALGAMALCLLRVTRRS